jgi:hypothetical protein
MYSILQGAHMVFINRPPLWSSRFPTVMEVGIMYSFHAESSTFFSRNRYEFDLSPGADLFSRNDDKTPDRLDGSSPFDGAPDVVPSPHAIADSRCCGIRQCTRG